MEYIYGHPSYKSLRIHDAEVHFDCHVDNLEDKILFVDDLDRWVSKWRPLVKHASILLLEISSNDLQESFFQKPVELADRVFKTAERIRRIGTQRVIIMQCLYRSGAAAIPRWESDLSKKSRKKYLASYMESVRAYNSRIAYRCRQRSDQTIVFRKQFGLRKGWKDSLKDGIHIKSSYMPKYLDNLRACLIAQGKKCRR